jgi:hypothetical protein
VLFRLAYLGVTNTLALLRLLPTSDRDKDAEILALRHQIAVLQRQLHGEKSGSLRLAGHGSPHCCTGCPATYSGEPAAGTPRDRTALAPGSGSPPACQDLPTLRVPKTSSLLAMAALIAGMRSAAVTSSRPLRGRDSRR